MSNSPRVPACIGSPAAVYNEKNKNAESESGLALLARLGTRPSLVKLDATLFPFGTQPCDVIEVSGDKGTGKSAVILHLILNALIPDSWHGINLGGCGAGVVFIDTDMHFSILQMENMIQRRIKKSIKSAKTIFKGLEKEKGDVSDVICDSTDLRKFFQIGKKQQVQEINELTKECLKNLLYLKCTDSFQYMVTLLSLEELVLSKESVSLVVIDSISAFYWYDRTYRADTWYKLEQHYNKIFKVLVGHIKKHKLVLLSSRQALFQRKFGKEERKAGCQNDEIDALDDCNDYEYMGREWSGAVTCRILLSIDSLQTPVSRELQVNDKSDSSCTGAKKSSEERTTYAANVSSSNDKNKVIFTIHEDGIRPSSLKTG